jgi:cytochrome c oxidase subunit III
MASVATSIDKKTLWSGGGVSPFQVSYGKLMMWFFLVSDAFTFSALLITYGMLRFSSTSLNPIAGDFLDGMGGVWPVPEKVFTHVPFLHGVELPLVFVGFMTFVLIMSSVTMVLAVEAGHRGDKKAVEKWMLWTILGGFAFLGSQAWEWSVFITGHHGVMATLTSNPYGPPAFADLFFFITGFHGTHVFSGVILNIIVFLNVVYGTYERRGHYEMVEKVGLYWHFVDLVWVFVFTFFYLV